MRERDRCPWPADDPMMIAYHDEEWGVPLRDDAALYAKLVLDGAQAGLSWSTILHKRDGYLRAFRGLDPATVARFGERDVQRLLKDEGIVRNRQKIESAIKNARAYLALAEAGDTFSDYLWQFVGGRPKVNRWKTLRQLPAETKESRAMAKALKTRGFSFCGPTICYAFMQAVGMVNDHVVTCFRHGSCSRA
jgi:DNA-3-methyladenine glycosylase I